MDVVHVARKRVDPYSIVFSGYLVYIEWYSNPELLAIESSTFRTIRTLSSLENCEN